MLARAEGVTAFAAVATEVFRKAKNGRQFLDRLETEAGVKTALLSQDEEARIGFETASALASTPENVASYDSGGGSFQIASLDANGALRTYNASLGKTVALEMLVVGVLGKTLGETPNPVSKTTADALIARLTAELAPAPAWLRGHANVVAIGGSNSIFRLCTVRRGVVESSLSWCRRGFRVARPVSARDATHRRGAAAASTRLPPRRRRASLPRRRRDLAAPAPPPRSRIAQAIAGATTFSRADAAAALDAVLDRTDDALRAAPWWPAVGCAKKEAPYTAGKLCLLNAVLAHLGIEKVEYKSTNGSCPGMVVSERLFPMG